MVGSFRGVAAIIVFDTALKLLPARLGHRTLVGSAIATEHQSRARRRSRPVSRLGRRYGRCGGMN